MGNTGETQVFLAMGGNIPSAVGAALDTQIAACDLLGQAGVALEAVSFVYETRPVPPSGQPDFINIVLMANVSMGANELLGLCLDVETKLGRQRGERWSARTLDVDLLAYGDEILPDRTQWRQVVGDPDPACILNVPVVPHPRLHTRGFVLRPMADIAPAWVHPILGRSVSEMLACLSPSELDGVTRLPVPFGRFSSLQPENGAV